MEVSRESFYLLTWSRTIEREYANVKSDNTWFYEPCLIHGHVEATRALGQESCAENKYTSSNSIFVAYIVQKELARTCV